MMGSARTHCSEWSKTIKSRASHQVFKTINQDSRSMPELSATSGPFLLTQKSWFCRQLWLQHMDSVADYVATIGQNVKEDIKVAVIDDGIDGFQENITDNIVSGISFCRYSDSGNLMNAYYVPSGGHGTMMASLICRLCPQVKLFVARLEEYKAPFNKRHITARSAAEVREPGTN
jgi:hypothetical protein